MLFAEKESNLIEMFQSLDSGEILLISHPEELDAVLNCILDESNWLKWVDSSAKDVLPPDFYSDEYKIMMEVMRVDDHGHKKKGKVKNPTRVREHQIEKELAESHAFTSFADTALFVNAVTDLPTSDDHNYAFYKEEFERTLSRHIGGISNYRRNHPGYKLIFFIFDESTMYFESACNNAFSKSADEGFLHLWFYDKNFTSVFQGADIDYLIWFAPYKHFQVNGCCPVLPKAAVYKVGEAIPDEMGYSSDYMISCEE